MWTQKERAEAERQVACFITALEELVERYPALSVACICTAQFPDNTPVDCSGHLLHGMGARLSDMLDDLKGNILKQYEVELAAPRKLS